MQNMSVEKPIIEKGVFPTRSWFDLAQKNYTSNSDFSISCETPRGIKNTLSFPSSSTKNEPCSFIVQKYKDPVSEVSVHTILREDYLNTELRFPLSSPGDFISVVSQSFLSPVIEDLHSINSLTLQPEIIKTGDYEWKNEQTIFLSLNKDRIWITPDKLTGQLTIISEKNNGEKKFEKSLQFVETLLKELKDNFGFEFNIKTNEGITDGTLRDINFKVGHTSPLFVNQVDVWNTIIGSDPGKPFFFPVSVSKGKEKII